METQRANRGRWQPAQEVHPLVAQKWKLTPREVEVLGTLITTVPPTRARLAQELCISEHTVKNHLDNLRDKARRSGHLTIIDTDDLVRRYLVEEQVSPSEEPLPPPD